MAHDVFISHSAQDKAAADAVCHALEQQGIRCWIAPRDIAPGLSWAAAIARAVRESRILVLIFSGAADRSDHVRREVSAALEAGAAIVPFRLENVHAGDELNYYLAGLHWLDATTPPLEAHAGRLAETVKAMIAAEGDPTAERPSPPPAAPRSVRNAPIPSEQPAAPRSNSRLWAVVALCAVFILPGVAVVLWGLHATDEGVRAARDVAVAGGRAGPGGQSGSDAAAAVAAPVQSAVSQIVAQSTRDALAQARQATESAAADADPETAALQAFLECRSNAPPDAFPGAAPAWDPQSANRVLTPPPSLRVFGRAVAEAGFVVAGDRRTPFATLRSDPASARGTAMVTFGTLGMPVRDVAGDRDDRQMEVTTPGGVRRLTFSPVPDPTMTDYRCERP